MDRILLTGTAGFIGSKTTEYLLLNNYHVTGVDNLNAYYDVRLKEYRLNKLLNNNNFQFINLDIENYNSLDTLCKENKFDAVINLAARAGVPYSMINPNIYVTTNIIGTLNILEAIKNHNIKKFILASTSSLYAGQPMPFHEELPVNTPISPYAATKKSAEMLAYTYHSLYGIDVTILRYFTVFGPAGRPDMSIFRFIKNIDEDNKIDLYGDGTQSRDFTNVDDIARGTIKGLKEVGFEVFNLGGGNNPFSINYVIESIEIMLDKKAIIDYKPFAKTDIMTTFADISKAKKILNWQPEIPFDQGLEETVKWHVDNREWLKDIKI